ncbi:SDR family oxidoreductase [Mycetocola sp. 2940]|uniref:SDR family NAD(P)-dependent oxidoreductase n=1 Tax=Mycetocola sp. 2940 TaxID=3156452 RepID=UPI00339A68F2
MTHTLITGGASGIGESLARRLAASGHRISVIDRSPADSSSWWAGLPAEKRGAWHAIDVTDGPAVRSAVAATEVPLDGLVTCAGVVTRGSSLDISADEFERTIAINLTGTFTVVQAVSQHLVGSARPGSIVTLTSTAGLGYVAGLGVGYHASKAAVIGLSKAFAGDLARHGIRVNVVAPGLVRTPMSATEREELGEAKLGARVPAGRLAEPDEVAGAIAWLLSPASSLTTGHVLPVEGGQMAVTGAPGAGFPPSEPSTRDIPHFTTDYAGSRT